MIEITSLTDGRVSDYTHVGEPLWLLERGLFVAEGRVVVRRLLEAGTFEVCSVLSTPAAHAMSVATTRVRIPIAQQVDSLNVVVAAGIALAAVTD